MSRSGYSDDYEYMDLYRNTVARAIAGKRGQEFLEKLAKTMDEMPDKVLIANELIDKNGQCCTMGTVFKSEGIPIETVDYEDRDQVGKLMNIAPSMAAEIAYENDETFPHQNPKQRWTRMRKWVDEQIDKNGDEHGKK